MAEQEEHFVLETQDEHALDDPNRRARRARYEGPHGPATARTEEGEFATVLEGDHLQGTLAWSAFGVNGRINAQERLSSGVPARVGGVEWRLVRSNGGALRRKKRAIHVEGPRPLVLRLRGVGGALSLETPDGDPHLRTSGLGSGGVVHAPATPEEVGLFILVLTARMSLELDANLFF